MAVTGQIGDAEVRLDNAAEEATMQKILAALQQNNGGSGSANNNIVGGVLPAGMVKLGKSVNLLNASFGLLGKTIGFLSGAIKGVTGVASGAVEFSTGLTQAQPKITDFTKSLSNLPWILGDFGSAINSVTEMLFKNYTTFQQLSTSGIALGGNLGDMNRYAASVGLSLDQVAGNLATNSEALARLGTGTRGALIAAENMAIAFDMNSSSLQSYGLSFEEINETYMKFFAQNSLMLARGTMTQGQLNSMSGDYARGLRRLSELTGIQADQIQEEVDKANMNKAFENFISNMDAAGKQRMESIISTFGTGFGDAGREAAMAAVMGIAPVTEGAQNIMSLNAGFGRTLNNVVGEARNFQGSLGDFNSSLVGQMRGFAQANRGYADANSRLFATLDMMGDQYGASGGMLIRGINMFSGSLEEVEGRLGVEDPMAETFRTFNSAVQEVREAFAQLFTDVFKSGTFISAMTSLKDNIPLFKDKIVEFINFFKDYDYAAAFEKIKEYNPFTEEGRTAIMDGLGDLIRQIGQLLSDAIHGGGTQTLSSIASGSDFSEGFFSLNNTLDPDALLSQAMRNQQGAGTGSYFDRHGIIPGTGYEEYLSDALEQVMSTGQFDNANDARDAIIASLQEYANRQKNAGVYDDAALQRVTDFLTDDVKETLNDIIQTRSKGTSGVTGRMVEPKNMIAHIEAGERVQSRAEIAAEQSRGTSSPGLGSAALDRLGNKIVDSNREHSVKLLEQISMLIDKSNKNNNLLKEVKGAIEHYG